jgi:hypothetical protein
MFDVLDVEDDAKRDEGDYGGPEAEVASPNIFIVFDLKRCLKCGRGDECTEYDLGKGQLISLRPLGRPKTFSRVSYQFCVEMPIALHRLWRAFLEEIPYRACSSHNAKHGDRCDPHIQKTRREVVANRAYWAPALIVTA